tara:strand:+ start:598 stop:819 length:222 start_codon:yes stop_codon:yes gene_type:complete
MNELEKHRVNRKLDTREKIVIKALTEKIASLEFEIKKLKNPTSDFVTRKFAEVKVHMDIIDELIASFKEGRIK